MTRAAFAVLAALTVAAVPFWFDLPALPRIRLRSGVLLALGVAGLGVTGWLAVNGGPHSSTDHQVAVGLTLLASVGAGGPITRAVLRVADPGPPQSPTGPAQANLLTGGAWIGALERAAVTAAVLAGWHEVFTLVLLVKGLGRYPELRSTDTPAVAERFIIGTFSSVLWAAGCGGVGLALTRDGVRLGGSCPGTGLVGSCPGTGSHSEGIRNQRMG